MEEIKDQDILEAFKLGDKDSDDKILHGVMRQEGKMVVVFERKSDQGYSGFLSKSNFDLSNLSQVQLSYLESRGYSIEK
jgi:hypothetical protein